ncbi:PH and SEC7 domain-containing protein-like isoform X2 [Ornithodoros turicata]|uniref:PH and SEC7 domain-containing protein-like isoform X2 n=1 Tax=Ornithodoros turicata TaxID=34597 RepID=UPI00313A2C93
MEELRSVKLKRSDSFGFGFSVFGGSAQGLPPVIYDVTDNSPAAFSGQLEAGDVIVEVNDTKVDSFTTKEVLKCLRLANDVVTLKVKKDPAIQERVKRQIQAASGPSSRESLRQKSDSPPSSPPGTTQNGDSNGSSKPDSPVSLGPASCAARKCEKFIMTGDVIITTARSTVVPRVQSTPASPDQAVDPQRGTKREASSLQSPVAEKKGSFSCHVRTSRSDDHLGKARGVAAVSIDIDVDDDMASSLNTLLDTKQDDRKNLWNDSDETTTSSSGKRHAEDTVSELDCCTSEMASAFGSEEADRVHASELDLSSPNLGDDDDNGFSKEEEDWLAEPDLSESHLRHPILDGHRTRRMQHSRSNGSSRTDASETLDSPPSGGTLEEEEEEEEEEQQQLDEIQRPNGGVPPAEEESCQHQQNDEESDDAESLHSFHYSPKAVDMPSASRLAKRLYNLEGFKKSDVSRHLSKNNDFARVVAEEYLHFFNFSGQPLDVALRMFLQRFCLIGETQERERVLVHFSKRYLDSNPGSFRSQDAVHTLTCALMLLNTDLHGENVSRKMTCQEFIDNLVGLNEGENFHKDVLKALYTSIKTTPLEWPADDSEPEGGASQQEPAPPEGGAIGHNPFLEVPNPNCATEYKKGYVMRKCCIDPGGKRTPLGKRSWKMFCATLRDLVLYLHKDEQGFRKNQLYESLHNSIRIHHSLAVRAADYTKKQHVFRLQTADQAEYLFQTGDAKELQSWIDTLNFVTASLSAPPLACAVGSQRRFQRPLLPVSQTKLNLREQLQDHENRIVQLEKDLEEHVAHAPEKGSKSRLVGDFIDKETFLQYELKRYRTYAYLLRSKMAQYPELVPPLVETSIGEVEEPTDSGAAPPCGSPRTTKPCRSPQGGGSPARSKRNPVERFSYKAAVFNKDTDCG